MSSVKQKNLLFRLWFYFRTGWAMYFAFILAAVNTLTVTYYLAIERYPLLLAIFPTFLHYVVISVSIAIPILSLIGYSHFKRTAGYKAEMDISVESNPYWTRIIANTEMNLHINLRIISILQKISNTTNLSNEDIQELESLKKIYQNLINERTFVNKKDLEFLKKIDDEKK